MARTAEQKRKLTPWAYQELFLADIVEHPQVAILRRDHSLAPLGKPSPGLLKPSGLLTLAEHFPLDVVRRKGRYYCFGHLSLYALFRCGLPPTTRVPVRLYRRLPPEVINQHILRDLLVAPVLFFRPRDRKRLADVWQQLAKHEVFTNLFQVTGRSGFVGLTVGRTRSQRRGNV